jgi:hypothetical protein
MDARWPRLARPILVGHTGRVNIFQLFGAVGLPVAMVIGAIAAWRASRKEDVPEEKPTWRDDSLDDWRKERARQADEERVARAASPESRTTTGKAEEQATEKKHQRLGG